MGPMTGRKMGRCQSGTTAPQDDPGQTFGRGVGQGLRYGSGYGQGRRCGRGFGPRGRKFAFSPADAQPAPLAQEDLNLRIQSLEQELEAVRKELGSLSGE